MNSVWPDWRRGALKASKIVGLPLMVIAIPAIGTAVFMTVSGAARAFLYPPLIYGDSNRPIICLIIALLLLLTRFVAGYPVAGRMMKVCPDVALRHQKGMKEK